MSHRFIMRIGSPPKGPKPEPPPEGLWTYWIPKWIAIIAVWTAAILMWSR